MTANEFAANLQSDPRFAGARIVVDRVTVRVYELGKTPDWQEAKSALEEMGFRCGPDFGSKQVEELPAPCPNPVVVSDEDWDRMVRSR